MYSLLLFSLSLFGLISKIITQTSCIISDDECPLDQYCNTTTQLCQLAKGYNFSQLYFFGEDGDVVLPPIKDSYYNFSLSQPFRILGDTYQVVNLNSNGMLSFGSIYTSGIAGDFLDPQVSGATFIAAYWTDIDTSAMIASGYGNLIFVRETSNASITSRFSDEIDTLYLPNFNITGLLSFNCTSAVVATWLRVGPYPQINTTLSTFQIVMGFSNISTQQNFTFVMFHYNSLRWVEVFGDFARAGFKRFNFTANVTTDAYELPGSGTPQVQNLQLTSNVGVPGKWIFRVDAPIGILVPPPPAPPPFSPGMTPIYYVPVTPSNSYPPVRASANSSVVPTVIRPPKFFIDEISTGDTLHIHIEYFWMIFGFVHMFTQILFRMLN
jgi:hypothetical protein